MAQQQMARDERSLGELFTELAKDTSTLVRQEVALAQTEMTHKAVKTGKNIGFLVVGGAVAYAAALAIVAGVIIALGLVIPAWAAALLVGVVIGIAGYFMITSAIAGLRRVDPVPHRTVETIKEDAKWLKKEVT
jgi:hypothetical protein